jgi:hypothetical protein
MSLIEWIDEHPGLAAWLQAIFTIIAIVAAIWISHWELRATKRAAGAERRMKAQGLALLLQPELLAFKAQIERCLPGTDDPPNTPETITRFTDQLYLLGPPGGAILQMLGLLNAQRRLAVLAFADKQEQKAARRLARERWHIALENCEQALAGLHVIIEETTP